MWHYCYSNPQVSAGDGQNALFVWNRGFDHHSLPMWHPELWARQLSCSHIYVFGGLFSIFCSAFLSFSTVPKITKPKKSLQPDLLILSVCCVCWVVAGIGGFPRGVLGPLDDNHGYSLGVSPKAELKEAGVRFS